MGMNNGIQHEQWREQWALTMAVYLRDVVGGVFVQELVDGGKPLGRDSTVQKLLQRRDSIRVVC
jgi:hypothetical protein